MTSGPVTPPCGPYVAVKPRPIAMEVPHLVQWIFQAAPTASPPLENARGAHVPQPAGGPIAFVDPRTTAEGDEQMPERSPDALVQAMRARVRTIPATLERIPKG